MSTEPFLIIPLMSGSQCFVCKYGCFNFYVTNITDRILVVISYQLLSDRGKKMMITRACFVFYTALETNKHHLKQQSNHCVFCSQHVFYNINLNQTREQTTTTTSHI